MDKELQVPEELLDEGYEPDILTLEDESGVQHTFEVLDAMEVDGERYLAMAPYSEDPAALLEQDGEILIMRVAELEGEEVLDIVDDEEELGRTFAEFQRRLQDIYDIDLESLDAD